MTVLPLQNDNGPLAEIVGAVIILVDICSIPLEAEQPFESVTLTKYCPGFETEILCVVAPFDHK